MALPVTDTPAPLGPAPDSEHPDAGWRRARVTPSLEESYRSIPVNHLSWWRQVPHFSDRYTCVVFAHRGFWPSEDAADGPRPDAFVDDLAALIEHLRLDDVRLVAQSMGGWTCLEYALRQPERVRALVMADTVGSLSQVPALLG